MTLEELKECLENKIFIETRAGFNYIFSSQTIKVNHEMRCKWELIEEDKQFYIKTDQPLGDDKTIQVCIKREKPLELQLSFKTNNKHFIDLVEEGQY